MVRIATRWRSCCAPSFLRAFEVPSHNRCGRRVTRNMRKKSRAVHREKGSRSWLRTSAKVVANAGYFRSACTSCQSAFLIALRATKRCRPGTNNAKSNRPSFGSLRINIFKSRAVINRRHCQLPTSSTQELRVGRKQVASHRLSIVSEPA